MKLQNRLEILPIFIDEDERESDFKLELLW